MKKQEGPNEVYERARSTLAKSLMDGIDQKNAAADYYFIDLCGRCCGCCRTAAKGQRKTDAYGFRAIFGHGRLDCFNLG